MRPRRTPQIRRFRSAVPLARGGHVEDETWSAASVTRSLQRLALRRRELGRPVRAVLLFLEIFHERLRVIVKLVEQLLAMSMQLFDDGIIDHGTLLTTL